MAMMYNSVLAWPTVILPDDAPLETVGASVTALFIGTKSYKQLNEGLGISDSVALDVSILLGACATRVMMIAPPRDAWLSESRLSKTLSGSLLKRLKFVDSRGKQWARVERYLEPIFEISHEDDLEDLRQVTLNLYELCLAAEFGSEVDILPRDVIELITGLLRQGHFNGEAHARLIVLQALFRGAENVGSVLGVQTIAGAEAFVSNAIDEILDDAEFLQASALRRWFSMSSNKRAVSRDLRRIINAFTQKKRWAQSLIVASKSLAAITAGKFGGSEAAKELMDTISNQQSQLLSSLHLNRN